MGGKWAARSAGEGAVCGGVELRRICGEGTVCGGLRSLTVVCGGLKKGGRSRWIKVVCDGLQLFAVVSERREAIRVDPTCLRRWIARGFRLRRGQAYASR